MLREVFVLRMECFRSFFQLLVSHLDRIVFLAAVRRAYRCALRFVEEPYAFGAFVRGYVVMIVADSRVFFTFELPVHASFIDSLIGALRSASAAANAIVNNF